LDQSGDLRQLCRCRDAPYDGGIGATRKARPVGDTDFEMTMDAEFVEGLLEEREWTWATLAREMGINKSTMNRVVRDETRPGRKFIFRLIKVFPEQAEQLFVEVAPRLTRTIQPAVEEPAA
jgi:DNA-binding XRE family transcriptional regulator